MSNFTPQQIEEFLQEFFDVVGTRQYIGARYVPLFGRKDETSIAWDNTKPYEPLTIVLYQGNSYTSRTYVPAGVAITDGQYWANTGNYNAQVEAYRQEVLMLSNDVTSIANLSGIQQLVFANVAEMQASSLVTNGATCITLGFYTAGDGGGAQYEIVEGGTTDDMTVFACQSNLVATLVSNWEMNAVQFGCSATANDNATRLNKALEICNVVHIPAISMELSQKVVVPHGHSLIGAAPCFGGGHTELSKTVFELPYTSNAIAMQLMGANELCNIIFHYTNQDYTSLMNVGTTIQMFHSEELYARSHASYVHDCTFVGCIRAIDAVRSSDYVNLERLAITPNNLDASIRLDNAYDLSRIKDIQINRNCGNVVGVTFDDAVNTAVLNDGVGIRLGRVDGIFINDVITFGLGLAVDIKQLGAVEENGGVTLSDCVFDGGKNCIRIDKKINSFGLQLSNITFVSVSSDNGKTFLHLTENSDGNDIECINIRLINESSGTLIPVLFDSGSESNRVMFANVKMYKCEDNTDNGTSNTCSLVNCTGGNNGLYPVNTVRFKNTYDDFNIAEAYGSGAKIYYRSSTININTTNQTYTTTINLPSGKFTNAPTVVASFGASNSGQFRGDTIYVETVTNSSITIRVLLAEMPTVSGIRIINVVAIGV